MQSKILRKMAYQGTNIYVWQRGYTFEYLFAWKGEIYRQEVYIKQPWYKRLTSLLGTNLYTSDELDQIEKAVISGAMASLDLLQKPIKIPTEELTHV